MVKNVRKEIRKTMARKGVIVRGADGTLYRLSNTGLEALKPEQVSAINKALPELQKKVDDLVNSDSSVSAAGCNQHVQIIGVIPV